MIAAVLSRWKSRWVIVPSLFVIVTVAWLTYVGRHDHGVVEGRVVDAAGGRFAFGVEWSEIAAGGNAIDQHGVAIRDADVAVCASADAILLGAVGGPKWDDPKARVRPEQALFVLRSTFGLFANLRPVTVYPAIAASASPVRPELLVGVDLLIIRELTGGLYFGARTESSGAPGVNNSATP